MTKIEFELFSKRGVKRFLTVILGEDEDIIESLKQAFKNNNLEEGTIVGCEGIIKHGIINYFHKHAYKSKTLKDATVIQGSGKFVKTANDYMGNIHLLIPLGNERINGTLVRGKVADNFKINVRFINFENR